MRILINAIALIAALFTTHGVFAETPPVIVPTQTEISPEKLTLARQVVQLLDYQKDWENELQKSLGQGEVIDKGNNNEYHDPSDAKNQALLVKKLKSININEQMAKIYAKLYTTNELRQLLNFYGTPDGKEINQKNKQLKEIYEQLKMTILINVTALTVK